MYTVWHVDKHKITFKLVINWTNEILWHIVVSSGLSWPGIIYARARYRAAARRLRNTGLKHVCGRLLARIAASNLVGGTNVCLLRVLSVARQRSLCRTDHSSRGVLTSMVCLSVIVKPRQ